MKRLAQLALPSATMLTGLNIATAQAQLIDQYLPVNIPTYDDFRGVPVLARPRPEYSTPGVQAGSFVIRPMASTGIGYDDNILGTKNGLGSLLLANRAAVQANSDWSRDQLGASLTVADTRYPNQSDQSYTNWTASAGGAIDIGRDRLSLGYSHLFLHQLPSDLDSFGIRAPTPYTVEDFRASYNATFNRLTIRPALEYQTYRFGDVSTTTVGTSPDDRDVLFGSLTASYEFSEGRSGLVVLRGAGTNYLSSPVGTPKANGTGFAVLAGLDYAANAVVRYRALAGYQVRQFTSSQYSSHSAPIVEASMIWTPTGLTTVTGTLSHRIEDTLSSGNVSVTYSQAHLVVDHEYLRNVLLQGTGDILHADYQRGGSPQTLYRAGGSVTWLMNRNMSLVGSYYFTYGQSRKNSLLTSQFDFTGDYTRNVVLMSLRFQL